VLAKLNVKEVVTLKDELDPLEDHSFQEWVNF
jgi:hypothetical protein